MFSGSSVLEGLDDLSMKSVLPENSNGTNEHGGHNNNNQFVTTITIDDQEHEDNSIEIPTDGVSQTHSGDNLQVTPGKRASLRRSSVSTRRNFQQDGENTSRLQQQQRRRQSKEDAEAILRSKFQEIIDLARYELEVDAYRGIFADKSGRHYYSACFRILADVNDSSGTMTEENDQLTDVLKDRSQTTLNHSSISDTGKVDHATIVANDVRGDLVCKLNWDPYHGIYCPSVRSWIDAEMSKQTTELASLHKKRRKNCGKNRGFNEKDRASSNLTENITENQNDSNEKSACNNDESNECLFSSDGTTLKELMAIVHRNADPSYKCDCDTNPLCFMSLGGAIDDCLHKHICVNVSDASHFSSGSILNSIGHTFSDKQFRRFPSDTFNRRHSKNSSQSCPLKYSEESEATEQVATNGSHNVIHSVFDSSDECETTGLIDGSKKYVAGSLMDTHLNKVVQTATSDKSLEAVKMLADTYLAGAQKSLETVEGKCDDKFRSSSRLAVSALYNGSNDGDCIHTDEKYHKKTLTIDLSEKKSESDDRQLRASILIDRKTIVDYLSSIGFDDSAQMGLKEAIDSIYHWHSSLLGVTSNASCFEDKIPYCVSPGLTNLGATCYLNSLLQCLACNLAFLDGFFSWRQVQQCVNRQDDQMIHVLTEMQLLLARMVHGPFHVVSTDKFLKTLGLQVDEMQDPNECSRLLLDRMHESFVRSKNGASEETMDMTTLLPEIFGGVSVNWIKCEQCHQRTSQTDAFMEFPLPITSIDKKVVCKQSNGKKRKSFESHCPSIQDLFDQCLQTESMHGDNQYLCSNCCGKQNAERVFRFQKLPSILNLQLLRYSFDVKTRQRKKLTTKIALSRTLYVPIHSKHELRDQKTESNLKKYILYAVQHHKGMSAHDGHYIAEVMDWMTGLWMEFNDDKVAVLGNGSSCTYDPDMQEHSGVHGSSDAYSLFYVDRDYLIKQVQSQLARISNNNRLMDYASTISLVVKERIDHHNFASAMRLTQYQLEERLGKRKEYITNEFFPILVNQSRSYKNDEELVWVHGEILRRYLSCRDGLNDIFHRNKVLLSNERFLCKHGTGLHPCIAWEGKMLTRKTYDTLISLLKREKAVVLSQSDGISQVAEESIVETDKEITNKVNLYCHCCVESYRSELSTSIKTLQSIMEIADAFDQSLSASDHSVVVIPQNSENYLYAISRQFMSSFQKYAKYTMKEVATHGHRGIDKISIKYIDLGNDNSRNKEVIDPFVNSGITCKNGNCHVLFNKRVVRFLPSSLWIKIAEIFPNAIAHRVTLSELNNLAPGLCSVCLNEEEQRVQSFDNIAKWANSVVSDPRLSKILSESTEFYSHGDQASAQDLETREVSSGPHSHMFYLVHKSDMDDWRYAVNHIRGSCLSKKAKDASRYQKMKELLLDKLFHERKNYANGSKNRFALLPFRPLICNRHGSAYCFLDPIYDVLRVLSPMHALRQELHDKEFQFTEQSAELRGKTAEVLQSDEYDAYINSICQLANLLELPASDLLISAAERTNDVLVEKFHPSLILSNDGTITNRNDGWVRDCLISLIMNGFRVEMSHSICTDRECYSDFLGTLDTLESSSNKTSLTQTDSSNETPSKRSRLDLSTAIVDSSRTVLVRVYEVSANTDLENFYSTVIVENIPSESKTTTVRTSRRSLRNRKSHNYIIDIRIDELVAKLKLFVFEKTKIEHISSVQFYLVSPQQLSPTKDTDSTSSRSDSSCGFILLNDNMNIKKVSSVMKDTGLFGDFVLIVQNSSRTNGRSQDEISNQDEQLLSFLMDIVGECIDTDGGKKKREERGFRGTLLQSTSFHSSEKKKIDISESEDPYSSQDIVVELE